MRKVFSAYAAREDAPDSGAEAFLDLPASPYELLDALDKLRLDGESHVKFRVDEYYQFSFLAPFLNEPNDLYELNALAQKLSELDGRQVVAFEGLLEIESQILKEAPYGLPDLIDIAYSTDCCHVVDEALNDSQLGRFCAKNGFVPDADALPDALFGLLDFERIGREYRRREGGVLVERDEEHPGGYVERHSDLVRVYQGLALNPKLPDYTILLEMALGQRTAELPLPSSLSKMDEALHAVGADRWSEVILRCLDCKAPRLIGAEDHAESIIQINRLAEKLAELEPEALTAYKALLDAADCKSVQQAEQLIDTLDEYIFSPQFSSPIDVAKGELSISLARKTMTEILPHLNLYQYGQALIESRGEILTDYGLLERQDGQPVQTIEQPQRGGMEML